MERGLSFDPNISWVKECDAFHEVEPEGLLLRSQKPATGPESLSGLIQGCCSASLSDRQPLT
jgi:hypothetical protein